VTWHEVLEQSLTTAIANASRLPTEKSGGNR
jgi:hypothetical protein